MQICCITCDILADSPPEISGLDALIYCPGSINLKPVSRLKLDDFRNDFEINKSLSQKYSALFTSSQKGNSPAIVLSVRLLPN